MGIVIGLDNWRSRFGDACDKCGGTVRGCGCVTGGCGGYPHFRCRGCGDEWTEFEDFSFELVYPDDFPAARPQAYPRKPLRG